MQKIELLGHTVEISGNKPYLLQGNLSERNSQLKICFVIPASPTDAFYAQVSMFRMALDSFGGIYKEAHIILSLGDEKISLTPEKWVHYLGPNTIFHWTDPKLFRDIGQRAQGDNRWKYNYDDYDLIIMSDADTILLRPIDELLMYVKETNLIAGVIAHAPFPDHDKKYSNEIWHYLAKKHTKKDINLDFTYTLRRYDNQGRTLKCPFYINFGFCIMTTQTFKSIRSTYLLIRSKLITELRNPRFSAQIALALAIHNHNVPTMSIPMAYNFPNDPRADTMYSDQLESISIIHYLRTTKFDRQKIFTSENFFDEFLSLKLEGSNRVFQKFIRKLTYGQYPFH